MSNDQLLLVAIEMLRKQIADLPLAMAMNATRAAPPAPAGNNTGGLAGAMTSAARRNGFVPPPPPPPPPPAPPGTARRLTSWLGGAAEGAGEVALKGVASGAAALGTAFSALLGPLGLVATFLTSSASGFQLFSGAMNLFVNSVGAVFQPLMFTLSVGMTAASSAIKRELMPAMGAFSKWVLTTGIPAMQAFADVAGRAASALKWLAESKAGQLLGGGDKRGGGLGALTRTIDRISGDAPEGPQSDGSLVGRVKSGARGISDVATMYGLGGLANAANWSARQLTGEDYYTGHGIKGGGQDNARSAQAKDDVLKAARLNLAEQVFQLGKGGGVGDVRGNWARAQQSLTSMSPFEMENLKLLREQVANTANLVAAFERGEIGELPPEYTARPGGG